ncbi:competence protein CoiA [Maridesulfovibrio zosterae]|uniref:competence protein CoiA n=1 Tax=Maridesulfovibrio zosterae TaxID=82171 RepID=UPI000414E7B4|nr:competence protein CoiA family protein [Maridesulfovibrio zosterae]
MQVALNSADERCIAFQTEKVEGPFKCPHCKKDVTLKKGKIREHHYAHIKSSTECQYGKGESQLHYRAKRELYEALRVHPNCTKCDIERTLTGVRPDVSLCISGKYVAIEIQKSDLSIDEIIKRTKRYTSLGIYIIWIFPEEGPKIKYDDMGQPTTRIKEWQKFLQAMYFGRLYYWTQDGPYVTPIRLETYTKDIEPGNWIDDFQEELGEDLSGTYWHDDNYDSADYGGHTKYYKAKKLVLAFPNGPLHLAEDFKGTVKGKPFSTNNWTVPSCGVWMDKQTKWW